MRGTVREAPVFPHQSLLDRRTPVAELREFLSPEEFRAYVGIGRTAMYDLSRRGDIPHVKYGRSIRIPKVALTVR
jgi:excisionase family DNA binding protein